MSEDIGNLVIYVDLDNIVIFLKDIRDNKISRILLVLFVCVFYYNRSIFFNFIMSSYFENINK